jgi:predicted RNase H-like nuclease
MTRQNGILTYTNTTFYPLAPKMDEVKIEDIAHALSQMCRANGHFKTFYSVAQHSINCAQEARIRGFSGRMQLACLLHDASEAYIADITRPVKCFLDEYRKIEQNLQQVIYAKFKLADLTEEEVRKIAEIDDAILYYEFEQLHHQGIHESPYQLYSQPDVTEKRMPSVEAEFMQLTKQIIGNMGSKGKEYKCVGIDSCKRAGKYQGWAAFWQQTGDNYGFGVYHTITDLMTEHYDADCLLIDIPIGLPETKQIAVARPDQELRDRLQGKKASVFNTPCRQAVYCPDKQEAKTLNLQFLGKSLSEQSLGFSPKIREVDQFLFTNPQYIGRLRESHPEYNFAVLNHGRPLISKKSEECGMNERKLVLSQYFRHTEQALQEITSQYPKLLTDDFVDAMVLAVIGHMGMQNGFATIPEQPKKDSRGLPMEIVYGKVE